MTTKKGWFVDVFPLGKVVFRLLVFRWCRWESSIEKKVEKHVLGTATDPLAHFWRFVVFCDRSARKNSSDSMIWFGRKSLKSYWTLWTQVERRADRRTKDLRDLWEPELHAEVTNSALLDMEIIPSITTAISKLQLSHLAQDFVHLLLVWAYGMSPESSQVTKIISCKPTMLKSPENTWNGDGILAIFWVYWMIPPQKLATRSGQVAPSQKSVVFFRPI